MTVSVIQPQAAKPIVLFSKSYLPIARINLQRAACLLVTHRAEPLEFSDKQWKLRSPQFILVIPEHIRMRQGNTERVWKIPPVNRREVLRRDGNRCQYCGSRRELTLDHVIPRSKGGQHTWENVVTACAPCNGRKGSELLETINMSLSRVPRAPKHPVIAFAEQFWKESNPC